MSRWGLSAWWSERSDPGRIELYTRWTFYSFAAAEVVVVSLLTARSDVPLLAGTGLTVVALVHSCLVAVASGRALSWALGRRGRPMPELVASGVLGLLLAVAVLTMRAGIALPYGYVYVAVVAPLVLGITALTVNLQPASKVAQPVVGAAVVPVLGGFVLGLPTRLTLSLAIGTLIFGCAAAYTSRFSAWIRGVVWELDEARQTQARLAVAEERLRFSRDLHDVLGRDLSVVALESELAVQLAQRGEQGQQRAIAQMVKVQQIARDSQRAVREVVRGYREAGLRTELAGARGVLLSAGIDCEVSTDGIPELPEPVQSALGWVVREATTNVLRHADAAHCGIRLSVDEKRDVAVLVVTNDGVGAQITSGQGEGSGLKGLRERLAQVEGQLSAECRPGDTFQVTAEVPLVRTEQAKVVTR